MADSDDGSLSQRKSHYNQQRSSFPSDKSVRTQSHSRPQSSQLIHDFILLDSSSTPTVLSCPSPAPSVPRRRPSLDGGKRRSNNVSRNDSSRSIPRTGSRGRTIDELLLPALWDHFDDTQDSPRIPGARERTFNAPSTLAEDRINSRQSRRRQRSISSWRSSPRSRRGTPATDFEITALPTIPDAPGQHASKSTMPPDDQRQVSRLATELYTVSYLIFFSILGTLARLGLQWLTFYPGAPSTFPILWANFSGTLVMGFLAEDQQLFRSEWGGHNIPLPQSVRAPADNEEKALEAQTAAVEASHAKVKKTIPLYIGLVTGFCGSFTSFSSFMRDVFLALANDLPSPNNHATSDAAISTASTVARNGGFSFMAVCAVIILTVAGCHGGLKVGAHLATYLNSFAPAISLRATRRFLDPLVVLLGWGAWLGAVFMSIWPPDRPRGPPGAGSWNDETWRGVAIFACVFAPAGCLLRFYVSLYANPISPSFPLGTFAVNVFGTAVLGMAYDLQHVDIGHSGLVGGGMVGCQVLEGLLDGFCGALTTVSTWILEMDVLKRKHAWRYGTTSVAAGLGTLVVIMGSVRWTVGWTGTACVT